MNTLKKYILGIALSLTVFGGIANAQVGLGGGIYGEPFNPTYNLITGTRAQINAADAAVAPALSLRQGNGNTSGYDFDVEQVSVGRLDLYSVLGGVRTQALSVHRTTGNISIGSTTADTVNKLSVTGSIATSSPRQTAANLGTVYILCQSAVAVSAPADTTEDTLYTCTVPANAMGPNGTLRITSSWSVTNNANVKTARVRFSGASGTIYVAAAMANSLSLQSQTHIQNRNSASSQVGGINATTGGNGSYLSSASAVLPASAVDTTTSTTVVFTCQKATAGDTCTIERVMVELMYGA